MKTKIETNKSELEAISIKDIDFDKIEIQDRPEEYTERFINLLTKEQVIECLKYVSDEDDANHRQNFLDTIKDLDYVKAKYIGQERMNDHKWDTNTYLIKIKRNGKTINFKFHNSYNDTMNDITVNLYDVLTCVGADGTMDISDLDFNDDSIKDQKLAKEFTKQQNKILDMFEDVELMDFPQ